MQPLHSYARQGKNKLQNTTNSSSLWIFGFSEMWRVFIYCSGFLGHTKFEEFFPFFQGFPWASQRYTGQTCTKKVQHLSETCCMGMFFVPRNLWSEYGGLSACMFLEAVIMFFAGHQAVWNDTLSFSQVPQLAHRTTIIPQLNTGTTRTHKF